jgi:hypothetical protein
MRRLVLAAGIFALLYWFLGGEWPTFNLGWMTDRAGCEPSYPTVCIPPPPPRLDCDDIKYRNFKVFGDDPHGFDPDHDGIGCKNM